MTETTQLSGKFAHGTKGLVLLITSLVSSLIMLDSTIVAVSLPAIGRSLGSTFSQQEWVISAYLLTYASLLLGSGALGDLWGRKRTMVTGLFIFGIASAACGLAPSVLILNIARAIQGIGGAMLLTSALAVISNTFKGPERIRALAIWGAYLGVALTLGPILGGVITRYFGWRWVFLVNVPACIVLVIAVIYKVDESHDPNAKRLDWAGILTFSPGLLLLVNLLISGNEAGWASPSILIQLAGVIIFLGLFYYSEKKQQRPMIDLSLFGRPTFVGAVFAMVGYGAAAQVMVFYLPLYLQNAYGFDPLTAGLAMLPFPLPMVLVPRLIFRFGNRWTGRQLLTTGLIITAIGNLLFWVVARGNYPYPVFIISMLVAGAGAGLLNGETVHVLTASVPPERSGMASGIASSTRLIGILFGVAGLGSILAGVARSNFLSVASGIGLDGGLAGMIANHVTSGDLSAVLDKVPSSLKDNIYHFGLQAFAHGFGIASLVASIGAAITAWLSFHYIRSANAAQENSVPSKEEKNCMAIDCRHPL